MKLFKVISILFLLTLPQIAHAACNPPNAPAGSMGCLSDYGPPQASDEVLIYRASLFPSSNGLLSIAEIESAITANLPNTLITSTAALAALPVTSLATGSVVTKVGYFTVGDMPPTSYYLLNTNCPLNAGLGDKGSQIPSSTGGYCWQLTTQSVYDVRWWGAVPGGADPYWTTGNTGNALALNNMEAYLNTLKNTSIALQGTTATGGGLIYMLSYPWSVSAGDVHQSDFSLVANPAGVAAGNFPCSTAALVMITTSTDRLLDHFYGDANRQPINVFAQEGAGNQYFDHFFARHWEGHCSTGTTGNVATVTAGNFTIALTASPASLGLTTGMIASGTGANGVPPRSTIVGTYTSPNSIVISKPPQAYKFNGFAHFAGTTMTVDSTSYNNLAVGDIIVGAGVTGSPAVVSLGTAASTQGGTGTYTISVSQGTIASEAINVALTQTGTVPLTFSVDPNGVTCGLNGVNSGDTWNGLQSLEWTSNDAEDNIAQDQYGDSFEATSACTNVNLFAAQLNEAVNPAYMDSGSSGTLLADPSLYNATYNTTELDSPSAVIAIGAKNVQIRDTTMNAQIQAFYDNNSTPSLQISGFLHNQRAANIVLSSPSTVRVWNASTNTDGHNLTVNPWNYSSILPDQLLAFVGGGNFSPHFNLTPLSGALLTGGLTGDSPEAVNFTVGGSLNGVPSDCGDHNHLNTATAVTVTLPDTLPQVDGTASCTVWLYTQNSPVTLANAANGTINGQTQAAGVALAQNTLYQMSTSGLTGGYLNWDVSPAPPLNLTPTSLSGTGNATFNAGRLLSGLVYRTGASGAVTDTTATATLIENQIPNIYVNQSLWVRVINNTSYVETVAGGTGVTTSGTMTIAAGTWRDFSMNITGIATPAITLYDAGGGNIN